MAATKFNVVLDIPLTAQQKAKINKEIQQVVSRNIAAIDNKGLTIGRRVGIPKEWLGIWLKRFSNIQLLKNSTTFKTFSKF